MTYRIIERRMIVPNIHELIVEAPDVAATVQPGQFVIVRPSDKGERIPLSVSDFDRDKGTITSFFKEVGESTSKLALLKPDKTIPTFVGPLGYLISRWHISGRCSIPANKMFTISSSAIHKTVIRRGK